jgi:tetratricopeptide (TPR) repeat protein
MTTTITSLIIFVTALLFLFLGFQQMRTTNNNRSSSSSGMKYVIDTPHTLLGIKNQTLLMVMVKNEATIITRLLESARQHLASHVFICDTGSTDLTLATARIAWNNSKTYDSYTLPSGFKNFEQSRNECKHALRTRVPFDIMWIALADADFEVIPNQGKDAASNSMQLIYDVNVIQIRGHVGLPQNQLPMLVQSTAFFNRCAYILWAHETLDCEHGATMGFYNAYYYIDHADGSNRHKRLTRDANLLNGWLNAVNTTRIRPRALYYLARTYEEQNRYDEALEVYGKHIKEETTTNYHYYSRYRIALIHMWQFQHECEKMGGDSCSTTRAAEVERFFLQAFYTYDGYFRRESLYYIAWLWQRLNNYSKCIMYASAALSLPPIDQTRMPLFLESYVYETDANATIPTCLRQCADGIKQLLQQG